VKYGLALASAGAAGDARSMGELAHAAEDSGWDGVFLEDYIVWQGHQDVPTYDPWISLAVMAMRTSRVRLGTMVTPLARRRPWKLAQELVTLDHLSNGRMILGVGLGDTGESVGADPSFLQFGEERDLKKRARMLDEALEIIARQWRGEPFSFDGEFYKIREVQVLPRPVQLASCVRNRTPHAPSVAVFGSQSEHQKAATNTSSVERDDLQPRIPIWVGGGFPLKGPTQRAARWDGSVLYKHRAHHMTSKDIRQLAAIVREQRGTLDGYDIAVGGSPRGANAVKELARIRAVGKAGATWWVEYIPPDRGDFQTIKKLVTRGPLRID
jgi:Luciferase-like monooxygenase